MQAKVALFEAKKHIQTIQQNEHHLSSQVQMLTELLAAEQKTNESMSAVRATMQENGLSISDILLLQSQNQFLQAELQVVAQ